MVNSKTATRVALYRERYDFSFAAEHPHSRKYLALYESDSADPLQSKEYREGVRHSSERWPQGNPTSEIGDFDARTYKLIQDYDPHKIGDSKCKDFMRRHPSS